MKIRSLPLVTLSVHGDTHSLDVDADMPLRSPGDIPGLTGQAFQPLPLTESA